MEAQLTERDPTITPTPALPDPRRAIDLTLATGVKLVAQTRNGKRAINAACAVVTPGEGRVRWDPQPADVVVAGEFLAEFQVTWAGGGKRTIPNAGHFVIEVEDDKGD